MTTRRTILGAAMAAPILAGALPALAQEPLAARVLRHKAILLENVRRIVSGSGYLKSNSNLEFMLTLNERLIDRHPDLFIYQPMRGPVDLVDEKPICAMSRLLKTKLVCELSYDGVIPREVMDELHNNLADDVADEFRSHGSPSHFYAPVLSSGITVDQNTFQPIIMLMTRFGTAATS